MHFVDLVPVERSRHLTTLSRPYGQRPEDRLVRTVLVVVEEDTFAAILLPPFRREDVRTTTLELPRDRDGGAANIVRIPLRFEPDVHVQATVPRRLRIADDA